MHKVGHHHTKPQMEMDTRDPGGETDDKEGFPEPLPTPKGAGSLIQLPRTPQVGHGTHRETLECSPPPTTHTHSATAAVLSVVWILRAHPEQGTRNFLSLAGFPCGLAGKESTCDAGDLGSIPVWEDPLEKGKATHSSILAWRTPQNSPWRRKEPDKTERLSLSLSRLMGEVSVEK